MPLHIRDPTQNLQHNHGETIVKNNHLRFNMDFYAICFRQTLLQANRHHCACCTVETI